MEGEEGFSREAALCLDLSPDLLQENVQEATNGATLKVRLGLGLVADLFGLWDWMRIRMKEGVVELDGGKE